MRILVIKLSAFGDIIHSLPVIECIAEYGRINKRKIDLHWLIEKKWSPILVNHPGVQDLIVSNTKVWRKSIFSRPTRMEVYRFLSRLRHDKYDIVLDINCLIRSAFLARLARARERVGFSRDAEICREKNSVYLLDRTIPVARGNVVDQIVELVGKVLETRFDLGMHPFLPPMEKAKKEADALIRDRGLVKGEYVVIAAGGGWHTKLLDEKLIAGFCDCIDECGFTPLLSWSGEAEKQRVLNILDIAVKRTKDLGDIQVDVFMELLRMSRLVIGPDTGTVHAGSAVETPTISYYGPSSAEYSAPRRISDKVIQISPHCGPCFKRNCEKGFCNSLNTDKIRTLIREELGLENQ